MNVLYTLYISGRKLGSIISIPRNIESVSKLKQDINAITEITSIRFPSKNNILLLTDQGIGSRIDLQAIDQKTVDEPLRKLSSTDYIIITDNKLMYKDKIYQFYTTVSSICMWKAIPFIKIDDIIDYQGVKEIDELFLKEGYARELKDASHILVPPSWEDLSPSCTPYDLLIRKKDTTFIPFSGRTGSIEETDEVDGRYIYLSSMPIFNGECKYPPITYNLETLIYKYDVLQERLQSYGSTRVDSICTSMKSLTMKLINIDNQFLASSIYDDVTRILDKTKNM